MGKLLVKFQRNLSNAVVVVFFLHILLTLNRALAGVVFFGSRAVSCCRLRGPHVPSHRLHPHNCSQGRISAHRLKWMDLDAV
jgi:hypothetical protein